MVVWIRTNPMSFMMPDADLVFTANRTAFAPGDRTVTVINEGIGGTPGCTTTHVPGSSVTVNAGSNPGPRSAASALAAFARPAVK